jgi:thioredoxin reductase (NADPH)
MKMTGLRLRNLRDGSESEIACDGFFPFIGVTPNSAMVPPALLDERGLVSTVAGTQSGDPRLFAAGAVRAEYGGTATQAMAEGISAAAAAHDFLKGNHDGK